ncbi:uncharacterized protein LOC141856714 [Brevipalpus obovatus]|uniref:uncharacterized protein LOC141856714 n=1 Tax=Brevipalpus obovatus TaxID=246614 RepID=UPI003D9DFFFF
MLGQYSPEFASDTDAIRKLNKAFVHLLVSRPLASFTHRDQTWIKANKEETITTLNQPSLGTIFYQLGKIFRKGNQALIQEDLIFLLKWGLNYGSKLYSFRASRAENAIMNLLIGPYRIRESCKDLHYITIPKLMIAFAGNTLKLAKDMPDTVSGVGLDKRLESPAYARVIYLLRVIDRNLAKCHQEAHLYARYMFCEAVNKRNQYWQSRTILGKISTVKSFYRIALQGCRTREQNQLIAEVNLGKNMIPSRIIAKAAAKWRELVIKAETT